MMICEKQLCTGCLACFNICKTRAIHLVENERGFIYPAIDATKCVNCNLCRKICPANSLQESFTHKHLYAALAKNDQERAQSTSGGIFPCLARNILSKGGYVYGAILDEQLTVRHVEAHSVDEMNLMRNSKYVQSDIGLCYQLAESRLKAESPVLFSGTPCQIAGLRNYLGKDYPNLLTIDILCHGVPSPGLFRKYVQYEESVAKSPMKTMAFRSKTIGWKSSLCIREFTSGQVSKDGDTFVPGFLDSLYLRDSCHNCQYASEKRMGDITLGDFWGYKESAPEYIEDDDKGISLVIINTDKGQAAYDKIQQYIASAPRTMADAKKCNEVLSHPESKSQNTESFWADAKHMDWAGLKAKYITPQSYKDPINQELRSYYNIPYRKRHRRHVLHIYKKKILQKLHLR